VQAEADDSKEVNDGLHHEHNIMLGTSVVR
jgi:hypothetical protein